MSVYDAIQPGRSARSRRCDKCSHINPASYLVCRECNTILSHSQWVDTPALPTTTAAKVVPPVADKIKRFPVEMPAVVGNGSGIPQFRSQQKEYPAANEPTVVKRKDVFSHLNQDIDTPTDVKAKTPLTEESQNLRKGILNHLEQEAVSESSAPTVEEHEAEDNDPFRETMTVPQMNAAEPRRDEMAMLEDTLFRGVWSGKRKFKEGTSVFESTMMLCIEISQTTTPLVLRLPQQRALVFGRDDPETKERPDIDLIPYGGYSMGISRRHAALELVGKRLSIRDLKSSNGTFLNDVRLDAYEPHQLRDGDKVRLGSLVLSVYFKE